MSIGINLLFLLKTDIRLKIAEEAKAKLELEEKHNEDVRKKIEKSMDDAEKAYYKSLEEIPTGWGLVTMQVVHENNPTKINMFSCSFFLNLHTTKYLSILSGK